MTLDELLRTLADTRAAKDLLTRELEQLLQIIADHGDEVLSEKVQAHVAAMPARAAASGLKVTLPN